jgi:hypothetical protein
MSEWLRLPFDTSGGNRTFAAILCQWLLSKNGPSASNNFYMPRTVGFEGELSAHLKLRKGGAGLAGRKKQLLSVSHLSRELLANSSHRKKAGISNETNTDSEAGIWNNLD